MEGLIDRPTDGQGRLLWTQCGAPRTSKQWGYSRGCLLQFFTNKIDAQFYKGLDHINHAGLDNY